MNINIKFETLDYEKYFKVSAVLFSCFAVLIMILILNISFSFWAFIFCLPFCFLGIIGVLISKELYNQVRIMENKAYYFDEMKSKSEQNKPVQELEILQDSNRFGIEKVSQNPELKAEYLQEVKRNGEIIELELN
jgi:uncharacterized membrane protein